MPKLRVLIAAAGAGKRAGLDYPKTLYSVRGKPILVRLIELLRPYDVHPVIIVSPTGRAVIHSCLEEHGVEAELIEQPRPSGMGDAILRFQQSSGWPGTEHILAVWGDLPLLQDSTVARTVETHFAHRCDFTFPTKIVQNAYTIVERDPQGQVRSVTETREMGAAPECGERDVGMFVFRAAPTLDLLERRLPGAIGAATGEHGFLYIIAHLAHEGLKVTALPIATAEDLVSLNSLSDLATLEQFDAK